MICRIKVTLSPPLCQLLSMYTMYLHSAFCVIPLTWKASIILVARSNKSRCGSLFRLPSWASLEITRFNTRLGGFNGFSFFISTKDDDALRALNCLVVLPDGNVEGLLAVFRILWNFCFVIFLDLQPLALRSRMPPASVSPGERTRKPSLEEKHDEHLQRCESFVAKHLEVC